VPADGRLARHDYETLWPGKSYEEAFGAAITTPAGKARSDPRAFDWIFGEALEDEDGEAAAMFHAAGLLLGRSLEPIVTLHNPPVLIVTGFLARTEHFRRGISDALFRHVDSKPPLSVITASGIRGEVSDPASAAAHAVQHLDYQYWPTSGAARMVLDEVVLPWAKEKAANAT
jgi:predicted NBD/HSP70 family sugar kinase